MRTGLSIAFLLVVIISAFIGTSLLFASKQDWLASLRSTTAASEKNADAYVEVPDVTLNLAGHGEHYCKAGLTLAVSRKNLPHISSGAHLVLIEDTVISVLSDYRSGGLKKLEAKKRLKTHIRTSLNNRLSADVIRDVYFRNFIIE